MPFQFELAMDELSEQFSNLKIEDEKAPSEIHSCIRKRNRTRVRTGRRWKGDHNRNIDKFAREKVEQVFGFLGKTVRNDVQQYIQGEIRCQETHGKFETVTFDLSFYQISRDFAVNKLPVKSGEGWRVVRARRVLAIAYQACIGCARWHLLK